MITEQQFRKFQEIQSNRKEFRADSSFVNESDDLLGFDDVKEIKRNYNQYQLKYK